MNRIRQRISGFLKEPEICNAETKEKVVRNSKHMAKESYPDTEREGR